MDAPHVLVKVRFPGKGPVAVIHYALEGLRCQVGRFVHLQVMLPLVRLVTSRVVALELPLSCVEVDVLVIPGAGWEGLPAVRTSPRIRNMLLHR